MGFEMAVPEHEYGVRSIKEVAEAVERASSALPMICVDISYFKECASILDVLEYLVETGALPGYHIIVRPGHVMLADLRNNVIYDVDPGGDHRLGGVESAGLLKLLRYVLRRLADGYFTLLTYVLDSKYSEHLTASEVEEISRILGRLAELGAVLDPDLYRELEELGEATKIRVYSVRNAGAAEELAAWAQPTVRHCSTSVDGLEVDFGWYRDELPSGETITTPYAAVYHPDSFGVNLTLIRSDKGYVVSVKPIAQIGRIGTTRDEVYRLAESIKRWREVVHNVLEKAAKKGEAVGQICSETARKWIEVLKSVGGLVMEVP